MKESSLQFILAAAFGTFLAYMGHIVVPLVILLLVVVLDYISGMIKAGMKGELCSRVGIWGIIKKVTYFLVVVVAMAIDFVIKFGVAEMGLEWKLNFVVCLFVIIWLIINECISILENVAAIGVPVPPWLLKIIRRLKTTTEQKLGMHDDVKEEAHDTSTETS